ncbi:Uu.00g026210.m01.CDS01 [Anthostomella pinea]|uniref:Uu.00g026210.m01.CDS01 n=1 Tax=Anthostomella pinea TaxID=933095 RepID=A0AAI8V7J4_9PEZI|nr:Uu.00g026210.m01.CDS01 [Anthostomella pinea]
MVSNTLVTAFAVVGGLLYAGSKVSSALRVHMFLFSLMLSLVYRTYMMPFRVYLSLRRYFGRMSVLLLLTVFLSLVSFSTSLLAHACRNWFPSHSFLYLWLIGHEPTSFSTWEILLFGDVSQASIPSASQVLKRVWFEGPNVQPLGPVLYSSVFEMFFTSWFFTHVLVRFYFVLCVVDLLRYIYTDYEITFKDLGRGGSPPTFAGWYTARLRAIFANIDVMEPPRVSPLADPYRGRLNKLPKRDGKRPTILGVTPQRQTTDESAPNALQQVEAIMAEFEQTQGDDQIEVCPSFLEGGLMALRRRLIVPVVANGGPADIRASFNGPNEFGGEIFHGHRDGASHIVLHLSDVRVVLESGWGERHPFATEKWYWKLYWHTYLGIRRPVPIGLVNLYAPRDKGEMDIVRQLIQAAIYNETYGHMYPLDANTYPLPPAPAAAA